MSKLDFFAPQIEVAKLHPNFLNLHPSINNNKIADIYRSTRLVINRWAEGFPDRDGKIVVQFQETFNSTFWEIYLHELFKKSGADFYWEHSSPDFHLSIKGREFVVEAAVAEEAHGKKAEWENSPLLNALPVDIPKINQEAMIRLLNSIDGKYQKYKNSYCKLPHIAGKPFVLAVNGYEQPGFFFKADRPMRAILYNNYVDEDAYNKAPHLYPDGPPSVQLGTIMKKTGAELNLGLFLNGGMPEISAIIHNPIATVSKSIIQGLQEHPSLHPKKLSTIVNPCYANATGYPCTLQEYRESIFDGLQVYHNPNAKYPLDKSIFNYPGVTQYDFKEGIIINYVSGAGKSLIFRTIENIRGMNKKLARAMVAEKREFLKNERAIRPGYSFDLHP